MKYCKWPCFEAEVPYTRKECLIAAKCSLLTKSCCPCSGWWLLAVWTSLVSVKEPLGSPHRPCCTLDVTPPGNGTHSFPSGRPAVRVTSRLEFCYQASWGKLWVWLLQAIKMTTLSNCPYYVWHLKELLIVTRCCDNNCYPSFSFLEKMLLHGMWQGF